MTVTYEISLPGGLFAEDGVTLVKKALIQEVTGAHQAEVAAKLKKEDSLAALCSLLKNCLVEVGPYRRVTNDVVGKMLNGDTNAVLLHLYRVSFGEDEPIIYKITCEECDHKYHDELDVRDVGYRTLEDNVNKYFTYDESEECWNPGKLEKINGEACFWVKDEGLKIDACFKYPTFEDYKKVGKVSQQNAIEATHVLYGSCLKYWDGQPVEGVYNSNMISKTLSLKQLEFIDDVFAFLPPGPDDPFVSVCPSCSHENEQALITQDFLSRLVIRQKSMKRRSSKRSS